MEKLLQWSIAQTTGDEAAKAKVGDLDPQLIQQLFGNVQDDPTLMKQNLFIMKSDELNLDDKLVACDNFEMLIENLDNAMNIENMQMWGDLINLLDTADLSKHVASIIGTLLQNNSKSQQDFLKYPSGMDKLVLLSADEDGKLKLLYALSSLLRHNLKLSLQFIESEQNFKIIEDNLHSSNTRIVLRLLSLLSALLSSDLNLEKKAFVQNAHLVNKLTSLLDQDDISIKDKVLNILAHDLISQGYRFSKDEVADISEKFALLDKDSLNIDDYKIIKQVS